MHANTHLTFACQCWPSMQVKAEKPEKAVKGGDGEAPAKKTRKKKDPNAPKNAMSAFMYFSNANRDKVKQENPGACMGFQQLVPVCLCM